MSRFPILLVLLAATAASAQTYTGRLAPGDDQLDSGEYLDEYAVQARRGETVRAVVTSQDFDTYVIIKSGSGEQADDDDCTEGETTRSCAEFVADRDGRVRILVTSYEAGETGAYQVEITTSGDGGAVSGGGADGGAGSLGPGDETLGSGEYFDIHEVRLDAGQRLNVTLSSQDFDPYVIVRGPGELQEENDDCTEGDTTRSCLDVTVREAGTYEIVVTTYQPGEQGDYRLMYDVDGREVERGGTSGGGVRTETGRLERGDGTLQSGEFRDTYTVVGDGGSLVVDLTSDDFDPYLIVETPDGDQFDNDDYEGALDRSLLVVQTRAGASYEVTVTSYAVGATGAYRLALRGDDASVSAGVRTETGRLAAGDETLSSGEYLDRYTFDGVPGQRLRADLTSDDFDTYLAIQGPSGNVSTDDDGGGRIGHSLLEIDLTEPGTYTVIVTSFASGETGAYELGLDLTERFGQVTESRPRGGEGTPVSDRRPSEGRTRAYSTPTAGRLDLDEAISGQLDASDQRLDSGEYMEVHTFDGEAGEPVRVEMTSDDFDTYLIVTSPSGDRLDNDDGIEGSTNAALEFLMPETGRYRITATSFRAGETGTYRLHVSQADALRPEPLAYDRIVGLFVGISDYDRMGDLQYTAHDATVARDAMVDAGMDPRDGILLTDREATVANVRDAFRQLAARADDRTMFVLFYSGHGGQYERMSFQRQDPDGKDESIELFDAPLLDDDLDALLSSLPSSRQLIVLDACFSGGFSKDVISQPGRMGLFSSEEDIVSAVALKFEAGGFLSRFFADAVAQRQADQDHNGAVTALELSHYLSERYVQDVRSEGGAVAMLVARETRPEHQKLVVDRGSIGLYESLFLLP